MGTIGHRGQPKQAVKHTEESIQRALWYHKPILSKPRYEMLGFIAYSWESDYLVISNAGYVYECEIKVSHADFLNEFTHSIRTEVEVRLGKQTILVDADQIQAYFDERPEVLAGLRAQPK